MMMFAAFLMTSGNGCFFGWSVLFLVLVIGFLVFGFLVIGNFHSVVTVKSLYKEKSEDKT